MLPKGLGMFASSQFYLNQAALCAKSAAGTLLPNQRETFLRAQAAWQALADREIEIKAARDLRDAERAEAGVSLEQTTVS